MDTGGILKSTKNLWTFDYEVNKKNYKSKKSSKK